MSACLWSGLIARPATQSARSNENVEPPSLVAGQVLDGISRSPVPGAFVTITGRGIAKRVVAEGEGRFVFRDLSSGDYSLTATKAGWTTGEFGRRRPAGDAAIFRLEPAERRLDAEVLLWRLGAIGGTVRDELGDPMVGIEVRALQRVYRTGDARWTAARVGLTDDRGEYRLGLLPPGEYTVVIPETQTSFVPGAADRMSGPFGARVSSNGIPYGPGRERGRPYAYRTTFYPDALTSTSATSMSIRPGDEREGIDFHLKPVPTFVVSGQIRKDGQPAGVALRLLRAAPDAKGRIKPVSDIFVAMAASRDDGRFVFPTVPAGQFVLMAEDPPHWVKLPVTLEDRDLTNVDVTLQHGFVLKGRLDLDALSPAVRKLAQQVMVRAEAVDPRDTAFRSARVDIDGQFAVTGLMAGDYMLNVSGLPVTASIRSVIVAGRDVTDRVIAVSADTSDVVVAVTSRVAEIRGRVDGDNPDVVVLVFPAGGFPLLDRGWSSPLRRFRKVTVDPAGRYLVRGLPEGDYFVAAIPESQADDWQSATFLDDLSGLATVVRLADGDRKAQDLRLVRALR